MQKLILLGDEALAQGAIDAGMSGIYAYPGTPSTEITEYVQNSKQAKELNIRSKWSANEKTAMEASLGMSYAGKRAMVCMKHVGLNVAADPFMNSAITGANGGLVVVSADDPSMHSSQNEQDSRFFGKFAMIPVLEPSNQQEAYDMGHYGFELSEKFHIPVLIRLTTRLSHSRANVVRKPVRKQNPYKIADNPRQYVLLPALSRKRYKVLLKEQIDFEKEAETSPFNWYSEGENKKLGIITSGIAYNYLMEVFPENSCPYPILKISQYPLPVNMIKKIEEECDELLFLEEGAPLIEEMVKGVLSKGLNIRGRLDGTIPRDGELNPNIVAKALNREYEIKYDLPDIIAGRPPQLCEGCPHTDTYLALNEAIEGLSRDRVFSDIGCYTLGALPPLEAINSCVDMGASINMAKGAADAGLFPSIAVIGDSTFTHSGMTGLLDAVNENSTITVFILDNATTAMTGGQKSSALGRIEQICIGLGVDKNHIRVITPLKNQHEKNVAVIKEEIYYKGVSVIIPRRECVQTLKKRMKAKKK